MNLDYLINRYTIDKIKIKMHMKRMEHGKIMVHKQILPYN